MPYRVPIDSAKIDFPQFEFIAPLTPSEQKCAFHVRDKETREELCLKLIAPDYSLVRLQREIQALQTITHPNVVRLVEYTYSSTPSGLRHYLLEEFVAGADLGDELIASPWARDRTVRVFTALSDALEKLRTLQVVHRDLKPANIRIRPDGTPVIIDFGLARHLLRSDLTQTAAGARIGTPLYFAPEQFQGTKREIDHRTDLFAVGIILHQALTGKHPFFASGATPAELEAAVCGGFIGSSEFEALPPTWKLVVKKLLEVDRSRRLSSGAQLRLLLGKVEV